jgi:hypothetical protein
MDVVAFLFCSAEQEFDKIMGREGGWSMEVLERENEHSVCVRFALDFPRPLSHRETVLRCICETLSGGDHIVSATSTEHAAATSTREATVRGTMKRLFRLSPITPSITRLVTTSAFDLNGSIPRFVSDFLTTPAAARSPLIALGYFLQMKETAQLDAAGQDARALGQLLVHEMEPVRTKKRSEELEAKLHFFFDRTTVLRELADVHPWFELLLLQILRNQASLVKKVKEAAEEPVPSGNSGVGRAVSRTKAQIKGLSSSLSSGGAKTKELADFTERDAVITGRAMKMLMLSNATPDAAVDEVSRERSDR